MNRIFEDRRDAGRKLAEKLHAYAGMPDLVVLALPRGGVPVGDEVARALGAPLDLFLVRKLGLPGREELAMGAIASGGVRVLNEDVVVAYAVPDSVVQEVAASELRELERRAREYRGDRPEPELAGKIALLVDDGLATGASMRAAVLALRGKDPRQIVVAVPVAPPETCDELARIADEVVCVEMPEAFWSVGTWYRDFSQIDDEEVGEILRTAWGTPETTGEVIARELDVSIPTESGWIHGSLVRPPRARGVVLFAHGSGSSRFSPRNRFVASVLQQAGFATLLMDLLTPEEERVDRRTRHLRFDIGLLADRLVAATDWITAHPDLGGFPIGYFGSSTGAAAALVAAVERPDIVMAVVSRGGRPDLAGNALERADVPILLIVGGADEVVLELNRDALARLPGASNELQVVPDAGHLFEEPGALEEVARMATGFFRQHLARIAGRPIRPEEERPPDQP